MPKSKSKKSQKQKQKQKQIQNVVVNVHQSKPVSRTRKSNYKPSPPPYQPPKSMPSHHTFIVDRPSQSQGQQNSLREPNNNIERLHDRQQHNNNLVEEIQQEEEERRRAGRPKGSKNREKVYAEPVQVGEAVPVKHSDSFIEEFMSATKRQREKLDAFKNDEHHQGLNISSGGSIHSNNPSESNLEELMNNSSTPEKEPHKSIAGGERVSKYDNMTLKELQNICNDNNIPQYGKKHEIIERLNKFDSGDYIPRKKR